MNRQQLDGMCEPFTILQVRDWLIHENTRLFSVNPKHEALPHLRACLMLTLRLTERYRDENWLKSLWRKVFRR